MVIRFNKQDNASKFDNRLIGFICSIYICLALNALFRGIGTGIGNTMNLITSAALVIMLALTLWAMIKAKRYSILVITEIFGILAFVFSYLFGLSRSGDLEYYVFWTLGICIPAGVSAFLIQDKIRFLDILYKVSWVLLIITVPMAFINQTSSSYSMSFGYFLLLPAVVLLDRFADKLRPLDLMVSLLCASLILFYGSRGSALFYAIFGVVLIIFHSQKKWVKILSVFLLVVVFVNFNSVIYLLNNISDSLGFSSRSIMLLQEGRATYQSGRQVLWNHYIECIKERPLIGWGIAGGWMDNKNYPHNIFIELIMSFGIPIGILLIAILAYLYLRTLVMKQTIYKSLAMIFMVHSFSVILSGTFLNTPSLYVFIGLSVYAIRQIKYRRIP